MAKGIQEWVGGSFHRVTIIASPNEIISALGKPYNENNTGEEKCNFDWNAVTNDGFQFTVYDWKEYRVLNLDERVEFHIGSNGGILEESEAREELIEDINRAREEKKAADLLDQQVKSKLSPEAFNALNELNEIENEAN
jgi:hypothetical protein